MIGNQGRHRLWLKIIPLLILLVGLALFFYFRLYRFVTLTALKAHREMLLQWVSQHPWLSVLTFMGIYIAAVSFSVPNAVIFTLIGGFLFGPIWGTLYVIMSATIGACIIFLAAKTALYHFFYSRIQKSLHQMTKGFEENAFSYLLFLRLVPVFPFWFVNIIPAFFNISLKTYFITTLIGIAPGTFVYTLLGNGLGVVFDQGSTLNMGIIFKPSILLPILGLALLSLLPIFIKKVRQHDHSTKL